MVQKLALLACAWAWSPLAAVESWPNGTEREVDEGTYMKVVATKLGWRIWRIETKSGVDCKAVKSAIGRSHPEPIGVSSIMFKGKPFLEIWWDNYSSKFTYHWWTVHYGDVEVKYRTAGSKFWEERNNGTFDADEIGEQQFELAISSWEYPELALGRAEEKAMFDLAGLPWAQTQMKICEGIATST